MRTPFYFVIFLAFIVAINIGLYSNSQKVFNSSCEIKISSLEDTLAQLTLEDLKINEDDREVLEVLNENKQDGVVIVSISNIAFANLTLNWILSLERTKHEKYVVLSFDTELIDFLTNKGYGEHVVLIPRSWYRNDVGKDRGDFGTKTYREVGDAKSNICFKLLALNQEFIYSDVDLVWMHERVIDYAKIVQLSNRAHLVYSQEYYKNST